MTQTHTPGPWVADECPDANGFNTLRRADGTPNGDTLAQPIATVYRLEDAPLLAAAPDMLAALENLLCAIEADILTDAPEMDAALQNLYAVRDEARAAIAKARGED